MHFISKAIEKRLNFEGEHFAVMCSRGQVLGLEDPREQALWPWPRPRKLSSLSLALSSTLTVKIMAFVLALD